jgi:hypothetical protein
MGYYAKLSAILLTGVLKIISSVGRTILAVGENKEF